MTDALVAEHRGRRLDQRVGVIAVDPSSPFTGGAVLGDRVRMMRHATDPGVYVRSLASRGHLGGLSLGVKGVIRVMGLIGCDVVLIETVGVGQSEVEIARVADTIAVVLAPGQGDSVQLLKAGLLEIGDVFVVNKADRPDAQELYTALLAALRMEPRTRGDAHAETDAAEVRLVSATQGQGVAELYDWLEHTSHGPSHLARRQQSQQQEIREAILVEARRRLVNELEQDDALADHVQRVLAGEMSVDALVQSLLERAAENGAPIDQR